MLPKHARDYLVTGMEAAPWVLRAILAGIAPDDPRWDARRDPERFTLREITAHLADWEMIFLDRLKRTRSENQPILQGLDEGKLVIDGDYAHADPAACLQRYAEGRARMLAFARSLGAEEWARSGTHTDLGMVTIEAQLVHISGHDGYHLLQAMQWLGVAP